MNKPLPLFKEPSDTVDVAEIIGLLRRNVLLIVFFVLCGTALAVVYVLRATPQFSSHGALYLGDAQSAGGGGGSQSNLGFADNFSAQSDVETQIELITSKTLVQQALMETGLNATVTPVGAKPLNYFQWRVRDGGAISSYLPAPDALQVLYAETPGKYTIILGDHNGYRLYATSGPFSRADHPVLQGTLGQPAAGNGVQMLVQAAGAPFTGQPGKAYNLQVIKPGVLADFLIGGSLIVTAGGSTDSPTKIAFLQFRWNNPYQAGIFLNQVMRDFIGTQLAWKTESASTTENFVSGQLAAVRASLASADDKLADYQSQTGILDVPQDAQAAITTLTHYQTQRETLQLQQEALQQLASALQNPARAVDPYLVSQTGDAVLSNMTSSLATADVALTALQAQYQDGAQDVVVQQAQVSELQRAIRMTVTNDLDQAKRSLAGLDQLIATYQSSIKTMPAESLKVISLQRSSNVLGQLYVLLMEKEQEAEVSKAATILNTRVVTPADAPQTATSPKGPISVLMGGFAGLVVGLAIVFGKRASSGRFESESEIRRSIALPVYGSVPRGLKSDIEGGMPLPLPGPGNMRLLGKQKAETRFIGADRNRPFIEAFRLLRAAVYRNIPQSAPVVILVISALEGDGKTTVAANLARVLAEDGRRVALVDGDLYRGRLQGRLRQNPLKTASEPSEVVAEQPEQQGEFAVLPLMDGAVRQTGENIPKIGRLKETELSNRFAALREEYEFIILDSPPLPSVADGMTLGIFADLILSVVTVSHTSRRSFAVHNELLSLLGRPHGLIINLADWHEPYRYAA